MATCLVRVICDILLLRETEEIGLRRLKFKGESPMVFRVVLGLFAANVFTQIAIAFALPRYFSVTPDEIHNFPLHKGGVTFFVQPWLAQLSDYGSWANYVFFAVLCVILFVYRDRLERS
jgi:hypothetical protein